MSKLHESLLKLAEDLGLGEFSFNPRKGVKKPYNFGETGYSAQSLQELLQSSFFRVSEELIPTAREFLEGKSALKNLIKALADLKTEAERPSFQMSDTYTGLSIYEDPTDGSDMPYFLVDEKAQMLSPFYPAGYIREHKRMEIDVTADAVRAVKQYDPQAPIGLYKTTESKSFHQTPFFNTYVPPEWRSYEGEVPDELPEDVKRFYEHLIPDNLDRKFLFHWLRKSLIGRCPTFLILCGEPGTGKTTSKEILKGLQGSRNTVDGKRSLLTDKFNKGLTDSTLIWFDELNWGMAEENILKEMPNQTISIEGKGVDATRQTKIFASYVIANNNFRDNYIAFDSRKFAPLGVTIHRLESIMTSAEIDAFVSKFQPETVDVAYVAQVARWLIKHGDASDLWPNYEYKGRQFYWMAQICMTQWQKRVIETLLNPEKDKRVRDAHKLGKGFLWSELHAFFVKGKSAFAFTNGRGVDYETVKNFFLRYRDLAGNQIFQVTPKGTSAYDTISSDFYVEVIAEAKLDPTEVDPDIYHGDVEALSDLTTKFKLTAIVNDEDELSDEDFL